MKPRIRRKTQKRFRYYGLGFPVELRNVPMREFRGEWTLDIDFKELEETMAIAVAIKTGRLTGNEVKFLRMHLGLTLEKFGDLFDLTRQAVMKWERAKDNSATMSWSAEKDLRLYLLSMKKKWVDEKLFYRAYDALEKVRKKVGSRNGFRIEGKRISQRSELLAQYLA